MLTKDRLFLLWDHLEAEKQRFWDLCAGLDNPNNGRVELCGQDLSDLNEDQRAQLRNQQVGFIFQNFQLLPTLTALENVSVPLELARCKRCGSKKQGLT